VEAGVRLAIFVEQYEKNKVRILPVRTFAFLRKNNNLLDVLTWELSFFILLGFFPVQASYLVLSSHSQLSPMPASLADSQSLNVERQLQLLLLHLYSVALPSAGKGRSLWHPHGPPCLRLRFQTKKALSLGINMKISLFRYF